jgi:hypothetical protein
VITRIGGLVDVRRVIMSEEPYVHIRRVSEQTRERGWIPSNNHWDAGVEKARGVLKGQQLRIRHLLGPGDILRDGRGEMERGRRGEERVS